MHGSKLARGGVVCGRYRILCSIAGDEAAEVFEAEDILLRGNRVRVTWLPGSAADAPSTQQTLREAKRIAGLRHPNVVAVHDVRLAPRARPLPPALVSIAEAVTATPLDALLARDALSSHVLVSLVLDAARGADAAHRVGVVHSRIGASDVLVVGALDCAPRALLRDFGLFRLRSASKICTDRSPEDHPAQDVRALFALLYHGLTGEKAEEGGRNESLWKQRPELPPALVRAILAGLGGDSGPRITSISGLIAALAPFAQRVVCAPPRRPLVRASEHRGSCAEPTDEWLSPLIEDWVAVSSSLGLRLPWEIARGAACVPRTVVAGRRGQLRWNAEGLFMPQHEAQAVVERMAGREDRMHTLLYAALDLEDADFVHDYARAALVDHGAAPCLARILEEWADEARIQSSAEFALLAALVSGMVLSVPQRVKLVAGCRRPVASQALDYYILALRAALVGLSADGSATGQFTAHLRGAAAK
jgi:Protein tyrosine and serine/threonine kinase